MRLNHQDGGNRRSIIVTNNEMSASEQARLRADGLRPGNANWQRLGIWRTHHNIQSQRSRSSAVDVCARSDGRTKKTTGTAGVSCPRYAERTVRVVPPAACELTQGGRQVAGANTAADYRPK